MDQKKQTPPAPPTITETRSPLFQKVVKGGAWMFSLRIITQLLSFARYIVLARLLNPYDFGILGIAMLTKAALSQLTNTGFQFALIQKKDNARDYLNSAWTVELLRGGLLFLILLLGASYAADFFDRKPHLQPDHIQNWPQFSQKLNAAQTPVSRHILERLSDQSKILLTDLNPDSPPNLDRKIAFLNDLNRIMAGPLRLESLDDLQPDLSQRGLRLYQQYSQENDIQRLNRLLLEAFTP